MMKIRRIPLAPSGCGLPPRMATAAAGVFSRYPPF